MLTDRLVFLRRRGWPWLLLVGLWAVVYLTRLGSGELIFEEGRRATPAREMLRTGDLVVPRLYGEIYLHKPPLFFWLAAGAGAVFGQVHEGAVRLPSALSALVGVILLYRLGRDRLDRPTRLLAALFALSCVMLIEKGRLGEIDLFLSVIVLAALSQWWNGYNAGGPGVLRWLHIGALMGVAVLTKGPAGPLLFYLPVVCFLLWQRQLSRFVTIGHLLSILVSLLPTLAWLHLLLGREGSTWPSLLFIWSREAGLDTAFREVISADGFHLADRLWIGLRFFGYFLLGALPAWPWLLADPAGLRQRLREDAFARFLLCAILPALLVVWLWPIGRPRHALFVCYPICLLSAMQVRAMPALQRWLAGPLAWVALGLAGGSVAAVRWLNSADLPQVIVAALALMAVSALALRWTRQTQAEASGAALACSGALAVLAAGFAFAVCRPELADRRPLRHLRGELAELTRGDRPICTTSAYSRGLHVDFNMQFYLGPKRQPIRSVDDLPDVPSCVAAIHSGDREALLREGCRRIRRELVLGRLSNGERLLVLELTRRDTAVAKQGETTGR